MGLSELTDPGAVLAAIDEFETLGRDAFIAKYRAKAARSYFLVHDGKRYDSKPLVAAALSRQSGRPLTARDFSGGEATVSRRLKRLGFEVEVLHNVPNKNPDWTREETILALDLLVRRRPTLPGEEDKDIVDLSELLALYARQRGVKGNEKFRNPAGVSMKVANLSRLDSDDDRDGLSHGSKVEAQVWAEFMPDTSKLAAAAEALTRSIQGEASPAQPAVGAGVDESGEPASATVPVSHGPRPVFGAVVHEYVDGENTVYIMRLTGRIAELFPGRRLQDQAVIKVGRTNDAKRRSEELNSGFPPGLGLAWRPVFLQLFGSADQAHDVEQALLRDLERRDLTIGREFAIVPEKLVDTLLPDAIKSRPRIQSGH